MLDAALCSAGVGRDLPADKQPVLVFYNPCGTPDLLKWMQRLAPLLRPWKCVLSVDAPLWLEAPSDIWPLPLEKYAQQLKTLIGIERPDVIWMAQIRSFAERLIPFVYHRAGIVLFEDGMRSYESHGLYSVNKWALLKKHPSLLVGGRLKKHADSLLLNSWRIPAEYVSRIKAHYLLLNQFFDVPDQYADTPACKVSLSALNEAIRRVLKSEEVLDCCRFSGGSNPTAVVLSQGIYRLGIIERSKEIECYANVIGKILDLGFDVLWKDHPRDMHPYYDEMQEIVKADRLRRINMPAELPIELVLGQGAIKCCVAFSSTALLHQKLLGEALPYHCADAFIPHLSELPEHVSLIQEQIPSYENLGNELQVE